MRFAPAFLAFIALTSANALAAPFDMSGERSEQGIVEPEPALESIPVPVPAVEPVVPARLRYLVPFQRLSLDGEIASRSWSIYLTPGQAAAARTLNYGYRSAIFIAPESSKIAVYVNDTLVSEQPVQSPERISERSIELPAGLLQPGANTISFRVIQQHRTDCTIESTYQLWTEIIPEKTYIALDPAAPEAAGTIEDVKAIGVDKTGRTRFRLVVPDLGPQGETDAVMRLSQSLALLGHMPNQSFDVSDKIGRQDGPGEMTVLVGMASTLSEILPDLPDAARTAAFAGFLAEPKSGRKILVISGPTRAAIETAVENIASALDRGLDRRPRRSADDEDLAAGFGLSK
ncbi:MAG: cellulose biosynthesis cyclic di-GMP-binding regulatory protein BcsB, partial [Sphingomonadales bacterium]